MRPTVYIHTNDQQIVGALLGAWSMKRASRTPDAFDVKLIRLEETPHLLCREGRTYLRKGRTATWVNRDLQSFSPLRRMVPQLMGFEGRAVVTDPDVFAVGDICDLLGMEMGARAILCRRIAEGYKGNGNAFWASSVMLLDCAKLQHWDWDRHIDEMFAGTRDYGPWIGLNDEDPATIGELDARWNAFDELTPETRLLHMTERSTQPWKTGLPVDYDLTTAQQPAPRPSGLRARLRALLAGAPVDARPRYLPHPDPAQERLVFTLLKECLETGQIDEAFLRRQMAASHVRADAFEVLARLGYRGPPRPAPAPATLIAAHNLA